MKYFYYEPRADYAISVYGTFFKVYRNTPKFRSVITDFLRGGGI